MFANVKIIGVEIEGVRGIQDLRRFTLEEGKNILQGGNGAGKSSFVDAIIWCLSGLSRQGKSKGLRMLNDNVDRARAKVTLLADGKVNSIERIEMRSDDPEKKGPVTIKLNGKDITQSKLSEYIPPHIVCMAHILFFLDLDNKKQREFTSTLMPSLKTEEVIKKLPKTIQTFPVQFFENPSKTLRAENSTRINLEKQIVQIEAQMENLKALKPEIKGKVVDVTKLAEEITGFEKELKQLLATKPDNLLDLAELLHKKHLYEKEIRELQVSAEEKDLENLKQQLASEQQILQLEQGKKFEKEGNIPLLLQQRDDKRELYKSWKVEEQGIKKKLIELQDKKVHVSEGQTCPCCTQMLSEKEIQFVNKYLSASLLEEERELLEKLEEKKQEIEKVKQEGLNLSVQIKDLEGLNAKKQEVFEVENKRRIEKLQISINEKEKAMARLTAAIQGGDKEKQAQIADLEKKIKDLNIDKYKEENTKRQEVFEKSRALQVENVENLLRIKRDELKTLEASNLEILNAIAQKEKLEAQFERLKVQKKERALELKEVQKNLAAIKKFAAKKQEMVNKLFQKYLKDVSIELERLNPITGDIEECFNIYYKGKDIRDISRSEKMRTGIEIATMIFELTGTDYFIFIDDAECLEGYEVSEKIQTIEMRMIPKTQLSMMEMPL